MGRFLEGGLRPWRSAPDAAANGAMGSDGARAAPDSSETGA